MLCGPVPLNRVMCAPTARNPCPQQLFVVCRLPLSSSTPAVIHVSPMSLPGFESYDPFTKKCAAACVILMRAAEYIPTDPFTVTSAVPTSNTDDDCTVSPPAIVTVPAGLIVELQSATSPATPPETWCVPPQKYTYPVPVIVAPVA